MSEPAAFALIRDGQTRLFADRWASAVLRREILWGPDDFEAWVNQFEQTDEWFDDYSGGAIVDFDKRRLLWSGDTSSYNIPRLWKLYCQLMHAAWPGFAIEVCEEGRDEFRKYLGLPEQQLDPDEPLEDEEDDDERYEIREAKVEDARLGASSDDEDDEDDEEDDEDQSRAWITLVDEDGSVRHRQLSELTLDLLKGEAAAIQAVAKLPPAEIPKEAVVSEGLILNPSKRTARIWGSPELLKKMKTLGKLWNGWQLKWTHHGYSDQCQVSNTPGMPMSEVDALAKILPVVLSTEQFNLEAVFGLIGGKVNKFAKKATGCLLVVLCIPLVLFGVFSGNWTAVMYSIAATVVVVVGLFMLVARRFRKAVGSKVPKRGDEDAKGPVVAGPLEEAARKQRVDQLLTAAKLPPLAEIEPHFADVSGLEVLAS